MLTTNTQPVEVVHLPAFARLSSSVAPSPIASLSKHVPRARRPIRHPGAPVKPTGPAASSSDPHSPTFPTTPEESNLFLSPTSTEPWNARVASVRKNPPSYFSGLPSSRGSSRRPSFAARADLARTLPNPAPKENDEDVEETLRRLSVDRGRDKPRSMSGTMKRKVVIMGAPSVGKTSLTQQYIAPPTYNEQYFPTIEATSHKTVTHDGVEYDCEIIDSAGQDEYTLFPSKYAVGVHGYLLVYSINSRQSFEMVQTVHDKILDFAGMEKVPCVVVGQKSDLSGERRVTLAEGEALAKKLHAAFIESSARNNENVGRAFEILLKEMQKEYNPAPEKKKSSWFSWGR